MIGSVPTTPDPNTSAKVSRYKWEPYRDTNWCVCRNERCIAILFTSIGVRGRCDSPDMNPSHDTASLTISRSPLNSSEANSSADPSDDTAFSTTSRSPLKSCEANFRADPLDDTAFNTISRSPLGRARGGGAGTENLQKQNLARMALWKPFLETL